MGNKNDLPRMEADETIILRTQLSEVIREKRIKRKQIYASMIHRVLSSEDYFSYSICSDSSLLDSKFDVVYLPLTALEILLQYIIDDTKRLILVSPMWYLRVHDTYDSLMRNAENSFILVHSKLLYFKRSYTSVSNIQTTNKSGIRIDRVLVIEPLPTLIGSTVKLRYVYKLWNDFTTYQGEFKFDWVRFGTRTVWAHKDEYYSPYEKSRAYTQSITAVWAEDNIEIALLMFNLQGLVNFESIHWLPPIIENTSMIIQSTQMGPVYPEKITTVDDLDNYNKKLYLYNLSRIWEFELSQTQWYDYTHFKSDQGLIQLDHFSPFLELHKSEYSGVEISICKNTYKAKEAGVISDSIQKFGILIEVVDKDRQVTEEVKRVGFIHDRNIPIQLRVGDTFILYMSRSC